MKLLHGKWNLTQIHTKHTQVINICNSYNKKRLRKMQFTAWNSCVRDVFIMIWLKMYHRDLVSHTEIDQFIESTMQFLKRPPANSDDFQMIFIISKLIATFWCKWPISMQITHRHMWHRKIYAKIEKPNDFLLVLLIPSWNIGKSGSNAWNRLPNENILHFNNNLWAWKKDLQWLSAIEGSHYL